ncbi:MAG: 4Fe-4S binding protein, partial [Verrucomicrobiales bacterium]|nr:4Fe-4S binding protein [Verrucomicrobiales bacterium]
PSPPALSLFLSPHEIGTALVTLLGILTAFTPLRGKPRFRLAFQVIVVANQGLTAGNLLAQSLLEGWTRSGVPWQLAPGLAFLAAAALVIPWATKRNVYCDHLCPHGAAQQLANRYSPFKNRTVPPGLDRALRFLPTLTILAVLVLSLLAVPVNLASVEPFNAYLFTIAGASTIAIALISLAAAFFTPLPYCKYGCPTGAVLTFLRSRGPADSFSRRDTAALAFLLIAILFLL